MFIQHKVAILLYIDDVVLLSNHEYGYKDLSTNYMRFDLLLALKTIYLRSK